MIKLIASDMDGTLLGPGEVLHQETVDAVRAAVEAGISFAFCTGRTSPGVLPYARRIFDGLDAPYYLILGGGAYVRSSHKEELLSQDMVSGEDYRFYRGLARELELDLVAYSDTCVYTDSPRISLELVNECHTIRMPIEYRSQVGAEEDARFVKVQFVGLPERIAAAYEALPRRCFTEFSTIHTNPYCIEVTSPMATKGRALSLLAEWLGVDRSEVMAIGDHSNDLSMVEYAGLGVAMGNATDGLKAVAQAVVADHAHGGVAEAIRRYALGQG